MDERKKELLKEIIESYIDEARPIGSKHLCDKFHCSSATIRNEMADLEELGYLEKEHISSGRIPSEKGYKYYVENLMRPDKVSKKDLGKLEKVFSDSSLTINDAIVTCLEIISEITNYTSISLGEYCDENTLKQVSIIPLDDRKLIALVCTDKGIVRNKQFVLNESVNIKEVVKVSEIVNKLLIGTPISLIERRLEEDVKPLISKQIEQYETIYSIFYQAFNDFAQNNKNIHVVGKAKMLEQPEYNDTSEIKKLIAKLEDEEQVRKIEKNDDRNISIYIGSESEFDDNVTVIKTSYNLGGEEGTIAIVGPKRMEYSRVVGLLDTLNKWLAEVGDKNE